MVLVMSARRTLVRTLAATAFCCAGLRLVGAEISVPAEWLRSAPGGREAALIEQGAGRHGWRAMGRALRAAAVDAYLRGDLGNAQAWSATARWAAMWGTTEAEERERWRASMEAEGWPGAKMDEPPASDPARLLAERLPSALRVRLLGDAAWSAEYFALEKPVDRR